MGLVKTRRLAAMHKQQRAIHLRQGSHLRRGYGGQVGGLKAAMKPPLKGDLRSPHSRQFQFGERKQGK